jgi:hypothetical protein
MTISRAWAIGIGAALALAIVLGGYELLQEHDALLNAKSVQTAQQQDIATAQKSIDQAKADQAKTDSDQKAQLAAIAAQRTIVVTPQQAAAVANTLPNLPAQVQVQQVPATPTAPATQQIVIPQADIPAFQAYKLDCDESNANLTACTLNAASAAVIQQGTASQLAAMTKERDTWEATAKGGTFWQRFRHDAIVIAVTAGTAYVAGRLTK